jgi:hypothetical protein
MLLEANYHDAIKAVTLDLLYRLLNHEPAVGHG